MKDLYLSAALLTLLSAGHSFASEDMNDPNNWDAPNKNNTSRTLSDHNDFDDEETRDLKARLAAKEKQKIAAKEAAAKKAAEEALIDDSSPNNLFNEIKRVVDEINAKDIQIENQQAKLKQLNKEAGEKDSEIKKLKEELDKSKSNQDAQDKLEEAEADKIALNVKLKNAENAKKKAETELKIIREEKAELERQKVEAHQEDADKRARETLAAKVKIEQEEEAIKIKAAQDKLAFENAVRKALATGKSDRQPLNSTGTHAGVCSEESVLNDTIFIYNINDTNVDGQKGRVWWTYLRKGFFEGWFNLQDMANPRIENGIFKTDTPFDQINVYNRDKNQKINFGNYFSSKSGQSGTKLERFFGL